MLSRRLESFVEPIIAICRSQFPRSCNGCGHRFNDFEQWISETDPVGMPTIDQAQADPFGMISWVNCKCGSTLILKCEDMEKHGQFMQGLADESVASGRSVSDLLQEVRRAIRQRVLRQ